jgi:hypothetical protein
MKKTITLTVTAPNKGKLYNKSRIAQRESKSIGESKIRNKCKWFKPKNCKKKERSNKR